MYNLKISFTVNLPFEFKKTKNKINNNEKAIKSLIITEIILSKDRNIFFRKLCNKNIILNTA